MWKIIAIVVVVLVAAVLGAAAMQPNDFTVQRSASIKAPPDKIFPLIDDFHRWPAWSPWEKLDPTMKRTFGGAPAGTGSIYAWDGTGQVGSGRMEITQVAAPTKVVIRLDFIKPFEGHNVTEFTLQPSGDTTQVTWLMRGPTPFVSKLMGLFVSMDRLIGKDFEAGLANMKAAAEQ